MVRLYHNIIKSKGLAHYKRLVAGLEPISDDEQEKLFKFLSDREVESDSQLLYHVMDFVHITYIQESPEFKLAEAGDEGEIDQKSDENLDLLEEISENAEIDTESGLTANNALLNAILQMAETNKKLLGKLDSKTIEKFTGNEDIRIGLKSSPRTFQRPEEGLVNAEVYRRSI